MRIGIDVGGTNTDAVLMDGESILASHKSPTTPDIGSGIVSSLRSVLDQAKVAASEIRAVMIGTTQFTNAVIERKRLLPVAAIRVGLPATSAVPPMSEWPEDLAGKLGRHCFMLRGGHEFDGREIAALDEAAVASVARTMRSKGIRCAAVSSVFSPITRDQELRVAEILTEEVPDVAISLSHEIGRVGLLERENATIMNACLADLARDVVQSFKQAILSLGIQATLYISQNDGTLMTPDHVGKYPVLTFASGPTNSMRGAARLAGVSDAMVVDIGGTTSDVGMLMRGFPRESPIFVDVGGVRTNFRMPDILAIGIGGGSIVRNDGESVGPDSVGYQISEKALVFGGDTLTATDIVVAAGEADIGDASAVKHLSAHLIRNAMRTIHSKVDAAVERMRTTAAPLPVVLVGGGEVLINQDLTAASSIIRPPHASVANAVGAAIAQVSGEVDRIFSLEGVSRDALMASVKSEACDAAVAAGADRGTVFVADIEEVPLAYLPGNAARIRVKAVGDLAQL